ncbi:MAG: VWA domain-containing protein, partial [Bacteroidia bacterium]|nr:VWA domain-containing protein [Bacteroidia bacterium]
EIEKQLDYVTDWNLDNEQVLVLAGDWAFDIAEKYGIYECQNKRTFRPSKYLAFYKNSQINTVFEITNKPYDNGTSANTPEMLAINKDFPDYDAGIPRRIIKLKKLQNVGPITNDGKSKSGKTVPFTYGQPRYTKFDLLTKAKSTSELVHGIRGIEIIDTIEIPKVNDAKVDILFVIDNSGSMGSYQKSLSDNIDKFISIFANAHVIPDFKIGIITTDNPVPITFDKTSMLNDKIKFISSFKKAIMAGTDGSATEKSLEMATIAVKSNFSRRDAMLFVNIISDENDDSPASTRYYIEQMKLEKGSKKVIINSIYSSSGAKHFEAAKITGGLCAAINSEYGSLLTNIGTTVMDLIKTCPLSETPKDSLKIEVLVNKKLGTNYIYNAKLNSIDFLNPLSPGDILDIVYFIDEKE